IQLSGRRRRAGHALGIIAHRKIVAHQQRAKLGFALGLELQQRANDVTLLGVLGARQHAFERGLARHLAVIDVEQTLVKRLRRHRREPPSAFTQAEYPYSRDVTQCVAFSLFACGARWAPADREVNLRPITDPARIPWSGRGRPPKWSA